MHTLLVTQHLLSCQEERHTLRCEHSSLSQQVEANQLCYTFALRSGSIFDARQGCLQSVNKTHIVVTAHIADLLGRLCCPRLLVIVDQIHIYLRMGNASHYTKLQTLFLAGNASQESAFGIVRERTTKGISHIIAEGSDTIEFEGVGLYRQLVAWISTTSCTPSFTIDINRRIYLVNSSSDELHRLNIVHSHQVETESVDMIFIHPVKHTFYHIVAHQRFL